MPSSVVRSIKMSGHSVIVAMRATTGRLSLSNTGRAWMLLNVSDVCGIFRFRELVSSGKQKRHVDSLVEVAFSEMPWRRAVQQPRAEHDHAVAAKRNRH